jgi:hypothetical protein
VALPTHRAVRIIGKDDECNIVRCKKCQKLLINKGYGAGSYYELIAQLLYCCFSIQIVFQRVDTAKATCYELTILF